MITDNKTTRRYHVYKSQMVVEYLGVIEVDGNIHEAKRKAEKLFDIRKSIIRLCDACKRFAKFTDKPRVFLNEINNNNNVK